MVGICSFGAYVPHLRLKRENMAQPGGAPPTAGERAVAAVDEDSLTLAVEAVRDCLIGIDRQTIDSLLVASTTAPLLEKQMASVVAAATDLREDISTVDFADSLRAGTSALMLAADRVKAGSAKKVMVAAADTRLGVPLSPQEQNFGDGSAALVIGDNKVVASIENVYSVTSDYYDLWRPADDRFVHRWQDRFAIVAGFTPMMQKAVAAALKKFGLTTKDIAKVVYSAPDARTHSTTGGALGFDAKAVQPGLFEVMGNTGAAFPLMLLIAALENAKDGDKILVVSYGDGVDVILLQVTPEIAKLEPRRGMKGYLSSKRILTDYVRYLRIRHMFPREVSRMSENIPGLAQMWRERNSLLKLHASKCKQCGTVDFPIRRICPKCLSKDNYEEVRLADKNATLFSFSTDTTTLLHDVTDPPIGRAIVDFEGGARMEGEMADWGTVEDLKVGMPLEMTLRKYERQGDCPAYSWKPRPVR